MSSGLQDAVMTIGEEILKNEQVQKGVQTTMKGVAGLGAIGAGTVLETVGAGTMVGSAGYALTGIGCGATQALITGATAVLPEAMGATVAGALGSAATGVFAVASSPVFLGGAVVAGASYGAYKFVKWILE